MVPNSVSESVSDIGSQWFAVRVRSNRERVASAHLRDRGFEEFSPTYREESQWSDRRRVVERFLFPGYVFCRLEISNRPLVLTVPGVVGIVGFGDGPVPVPDEQITGVRTLVSSGLAVSPWPFLAEGQLVLVERGPLTGMRAIVQELKGNLRLVVSINLLQRSVSAEIDRAWVSPLSESQSRTRLTGGSWVDPSAP